MKINGNKPPENQEVQLKVQKADRNNAAEEKGAVNKAGSDRVNLSDRAKEIAKLKSEINNLPEIRTEKVQEIQKAVANGTYKIDSIKIAQKMIDELA